MDVLLLIAALVAVVSSAHFSLEDLEFHEWKLKFGKSYGSVEEESYRKMTWLINRKLVLEHNVLADQGIKSYRLGMNTFSDMHHDEFRKVMLRDNLGSFNFTKTQSKATVLRLAKGTVLPDTVDWRNEGYVTPVKDQGLCGSCWAFSTTGSLEGQTFKKTGKLVSLSEQQLVDCSWGYGNNGCKGGTMSNAYVYILSIGGLDTESSYPYEGKNGSCRYNPSTVGATCKNYDWIAFDEYDLQMAVATIGPISAAIDASQSSFKSYSSGVYDEPLCTTSLNHAVLIVGYGVENGKDYWLVKNSWGTSWGEEGYIKMSRNKNNQCGIANYATYPIV